MNIKNTKAGANTNAKTDPAVGISSKAKNNVDNKLVSTTPKIGLHRTKANKLNINKKMIRSFILLVRRAFGDG